VSGPRVFSAEAPAKVNRELRVGPRRADGFHAIRSRFTSIALADRIEAAEAETLTLACDPPELPTDRSNLVMRAALLLSERLGIAPRARLTLHKRIPVGAGLGGGSSDAAATLRLLLRLWDRSLPAEALAALAASLGSDVPYFLSGGEADVSGRGEFVAARDDSRGEEVLLFVPPFAISTAEVYRAFDRVGGAAVPPERLEIETSGRFFGPNDLEGAAMRVRPEMREFLATGRSLARECAMTGSGSTIVLAGAAPEAAEAIAARHPGARVLPSRTISRAEFVRRGAGEGAEAAAKA
jgi:4-diphosphocytidyl-2-C-methyl-D-erythritol kinase